MWMLPALALAAVAVYVGYLRYEAQKESARRAYIPVGPDPRFELEAINAEIERLAADSRQHLESARDALRSGLR